MEEKQKRKRRLVILSCLFVLGGIWIGTWLTHRDGWIAQMIRLSAVTWEKPGIFGPFHLIMLGICAVATVAVLIFGDRVKEEHLDTWVFAAGVILFGMELYKQLFYHTVWDNGAYHFGIFPLQFCSYSMYLFLLLPLLPESKAKDALYGFCALYQTMGGWIVMAYPMLYREITLSFHTMLWHTVMIVTGSLLVKKKGYGKHYVKEMAIPTGIFLITFGVATALNFWLTPYTASSAEPLNLFYMSPYQNNRYWIIRDVRDAWGWFPAMITYALLFIFVGATLIFWIGRLTRRKK